MDSPNCVVGDGALPVRDTVKCLGYWWSKDLVALKCVDENIKKARKAFFGYGSLGVFQGSLNPLSSASVIDCCVLSVLLYGAENWILTPVLLDRLEKFQGELAKRVLRWPRHHSNTAAVVALGLESVKSRVLGLKLGFLQRVLDGGAELVSGRAVESCEKGVSSLCLVKECEDLEETCEVKYCRRILDGVEHWGKEMKEKIRKQDREGLLLKCRDKAPLIVKVEEGVGWRRLWSEVMEHKLSYTRGLQAVARLMSHHGKGKKPCPCCELESLPCSVLDHVLAEHVYTASSGDEVVEQLKDLNFQPIADFRNIYSYLSLCFCVSCSMWALQYNL